MAVSFTVASAQTFYTSSSPVAAIPLTMACWIYPVSTLAAPGCDIAIGVKNGSDRLQLGLNSSTNLISANTFAATAPGQVNPTGAAPLNAWTHTCGVWTSLTSRTAYRDGANAATNTNTQSAQAAFDYISIGSRYLNNSLGSYVNGRIAEVGVWSAALSASEVASLAAGVSCRFVRPQSLVFYAPLIRNIVDAKGGLAITSVNSPPVADHPRIYA